MSAAANRRPARSAFASRLATALALAALLALPLGAALAGPAAAAEPQNLRDQLTDDVGALSAGGRRDVEAALDDLLDATGVQLWTWYTDTTGGLSAPQFADETATLSSLGGTDLLLVIALDDRAYGYSRPDAFPVSDAELEQLLSRELEPGLREEDYAGAVVQFAGALGVELGAPAPTTPPATAAPAPPAEGGSGGGGLGTILMVIVVVGLVGGVAWFLLVRRRHGAALGVDGSGRAATPGGGDPLANLSDKDLNAEANRLLLATDDAVRDSEQELGFAEAQFGEAAAVPFREAIAAAKADLRAAFGIRQQLDDATPEDRPTRRRMLADLIGRCRQAQGRLDAEAARFEELRAFEREAPRVLAGLPAAADAVEARIPGVVATMARLQQYADAAWQPVAPNIDEARGRVDAARAAIAEGEQRAAAGDDGPRVAAATRVGQEAIAHGGEFLDAVEHLAKELDEARDRVDGEIADATADLARAREAAAAGPPDAALPGRLAEAETLLADARQEIGYPKPDVGAAYERARRANVIADEVLAGIRTAAEQRAALAARLDTSIRGAQATADPGRRLRRHASRRRRGDRPDAPRRGRATPRRGRRCWRDRPGGRHPRGRARRPPRQRGARPRPAGLRRVGRPVARRRRAVVVAAVVAATSRRPSSAGSSAGCSPAAAAAAAASPPAAEVAAAVAAAGVAARSAVAGRRAAAARPAAADGEPRSTMIVGGAGRTARRPTEPRPRAAPRSGAAQEDGGDAPWRRPRSSDAWASWSGRTSTRSSTAPRIPRRCSTRW